jgi:hypothetical protein
MIYYINNNKLSNNNSITLQNISKSNQLKNLTNYQQILILNNLEPSQLKSLDIIPITPNIINIINNQNINNIDFSKFYPNELLFLTKNQVESLSTSQILSICNINIHSLTNNITAIISIYNKLSFIQIQNIATSEKYNAFPYNRLSSDTFSLLLKSLPEINVKKIINIPMFLTTLPLEHVSIVKTYLLPFQIEKIDSTINDIMIHVEKLIENVPSLPIPLKLENGEYDKNLETNNQLIEYLPIILVLGSPLLSSKLAKGNDPVKILKSLPKIILIYLIPTKIIDLYFIDQHLCKLFNDAELINKLSELKPLKETKPILKDEIYINEIKTFTYSEIQKLNKNELINMNKIQLSTIILYLTSQQLLLLDFTPLTSNIQNIINKDITNIDLSNYSSVELLFLSVSQVRQLSNSQIKSLGDLTNYQNTTISIEETSKMINSTKFYVIIHKLNSKQIQYLLTSNNYLFPLNKLSIEQLNSIPKSYFSNMPEVLPSVILTLSIKKFNSIKNNFNNKQLELYNNKINDLVKSITESIKKINSDSMLLLLTLILSSQQIGLKLLELNIDPVNILKNISPSLKEKLIMSKVNIETLMFLDPYTLYLYNNSGLIAPF